MIEYSPICEECSKRLNPEETENDAFTKMYGKSIDIKFSLVCCECKKHFVHGRYAWFKRLERPVSTEIVKENEVPKQVPKSSGRYPWGK